MRDEPENACVGEIICGDGETLDFVTRFAQQLDLEVRNGILPTVMAMLVVNLQNALGSWHRSPF